MRHQLMATYCGIAALGLASSACSLLGTYASSASSMMTQPGVGTATPGAAGSPASTPSTAGSPGASTTGTSDQADSKKSEPTTVSVTLRSSCSDTVKVFFGEKPKFGSGRYSSLSGNSRTNQTFKPGDMLWIVDDGQNGVDSVTVEANTKEIEVASSCDAFRTR